MRRGRPMSRRKGGLPWEGESKHRLASDRSLACMGMPAREGSRSSEAELLSFTATPSPNGTPREDPGTKGLLRRLQT